MQGYLLLVDEAHPLAIEPGFKLSDGRKIGLEEHKEGDALLTLGEAVHPIEIARDGDRIWVHYQGRAHEMIWRDAVDHLDHEAGASQSDVARASMPGSVVKLAVVAGDEVSAGDVLVVIESMKLEATIRASRGGIVEAVHVAVGDNFERDARLVSLAQEGA